jgi:hypothetical protein
MVMIEVIANDRLGKKVRIKCDSEDTVGDLKVWCFPPTLRIRGAGVTFPNPSFVFTDY